MGGMKDYLLGVFIGIKDRAKRVWELIPAVQTKLSPSAEIAKNVVITDVLPPYTTYNAACTAGSASDLPKPMPISPR